VWTLLGRFTQRSEFRKGRRKSVRPGCGHLNMRLTPRSDEFYESREAAEISELPGLSEQVRPADSPLPSVAASSHDAATIPAGNYEKSFWIPL
jgi:hypothetical protein